MRSARLRKHHINGEWWARDGTGSWFRWDSAAADWIAAPAPGGASKEPGPRTDRPAPWASDPTKRKVFVLLGPVVVLVAGLATVRAAGLNPSSFLVAFPLLAGGLVTAILLWGKQAATAHARGEPAERPSLKAGLAFAVAASALPIAMIVTSEGPGAATIVSGASIVAGVALAIGIIYVPPRMSPLWLVVPVSVLAGGAGAGALALIAVAFSIWGGPGPSHLGSIVMWLLCAGLAYITFGGFAGAFSGNRLTRQEWLHGAGYTAVGSLLGYALATALIGAAF